MKRILIVVVLILALNSCRESYDPEIVSSQSSMLVVEGNLNAGGVTTIRLTKTFKLDDTAKLVTENNAQLTVEGKDNTIQNLVRTTNGNYSASLNLLIGSEYRVRIKIGGKEYLSEYVKIRTTPDIDSISWDRDAEGVTIYANTKDPSGNSRYYLWNYEETWEIRSYFYSYFIYQNGVLRRRNLPAEEVFTCWKTNRSSDILLANSVNLQEDIIYKKPLNFIPENDEKLEIRYSILVKQKALEKSAYDFFEIMKKNTEEIGSFFAPQPSEITGNVLCVSNPAEKVIGYLTASVEKEKRIFITIPGWDFNLPCYSIIVPDNKDSIDYYFGVRGFIPYDENTIPQQYYGGPPQCVDCTKRNGSLVKPSFW